MNKIDPKELPTIIGSCRSIKEVMEKNNLKRNFYSILVRQNLIEQAKEIFKQNRLINPVVEKKYPKQFMSDLANVCTSYDQMGERMNLTRERVRQILRSHHILDEVKTTLALNRKKVHEQQI